MALLDCDGLCLEIRILSTCRDEHAYTEYEVGFLWNGAPLIKNSILKRARARTRKARPGFLEVHDHGEDCLVDIVSKVLETSEPDYWEPLEPDVTVAFYPSMLFPFLESHIVPLWKRGESGNESQGRAPEEAAVGGPLPGDPMAVIARVDPTNLIGGAGYWCDAGPALVLRSSRGQVERFLEDLRIERANAERADSLRRGAPKWVQEEISDAAEG